MILHREYLEFLFKTGLTQSQFLLLYLLYKNDQDSINKFKERFPTEDGSMIGKILTKDLIDNGWVKVGYKGKLSVTLKFRNHFVYEEEALEQLLDLYPPFIDKGDGIKIPLTTVDRYQYSLIYNRVIHYSAKEHIEILKDLKFAIDNGYIRFGIAKFIDGQLWKPLRKLRLEDNEPINLDIFDEDF